MRNAIVGTAIVVMALTAASAAAAPTTADKCEASKNKIAGSYYACREKAEAAAISKGVPADYSKCTAKFDDKWDGAETKGMPDCPDNVLTAPMNAYIAGQAASAVSIISGADNIPACGDGEINTVGEQCDGAALGGATCASLGHTPGTLACTAGCQFNTSGCDVCPGFVYEGDCWILAAASASCDTACGAVGMVYDSSTRFVAGSEGSDASCQAVLDGLSAPGTGLDSPSASCSSGLGCVVGLARVRCATPVTTSSVSTSMGQRVCACH
jgi:hypothetical protein